MDVDQLYDDTMNHLKTELEGKIAIVLRDANNFSRGDIFALPAHHFANQLIKLLEGVDIVRRVETTKPTSELPDARTEIVNLMHAGSNRTVVL